MSNPCLIMIVLCGSNAAIAKAEHSLKNIFVGTWDHAVDEGGIRVPRAHRPPAYTYFLAYPWGPPGAELDKMAAANPDIILAVTYAEEGVGFRGQVFFVDGKRVAIHEGAYGPDGHDFYDGIAPLPDFNSTLDFYIFTRNWNGKEAAFAEAER